MPKIDTDAIQREQAQLLRERGMGQTRVVETTGLTISALRYLEKKIKVGEPDDTLHLKIKNGEACSFCGAPIEQHGGAGRPRRFCSDHCRRQYWRLHRSEQKKNPDIIFTRICKYCGQPFEIYGKNDRKYCCREHYLKDFFGDKEERETQNRRALLVRSLADLSRTLG